MTMLYKKNIIIVLALVSVLFSSCIENDIPYPVIKGEIKAFEVSGQISSTIDAETRTVTVDLADSVYLKQVRVLRLEVTDATTVSPEITSTIDLSKPFEYTLTTYQSYVWTIKAVQSVSRYINVDNQIGAALFDLDTKMALVTVSSAASLQNINVTSMKLGNEGSTITPDPATVHDFSKLVKFTVDYHGTTEIWSVRIIKSETSIYTGEANAWAKHATVTGTFQTGSGSPTFQYKKSSESQWTTFPTSSVSVTGGSFSADLSPLDPETQYDYKAVSGTNTGEQKSFTTEGVPQVVNSNFNDWIKGSDSGNSSFSSAQNKSWFPNKDFSSEYYFWDTGNVGSNSLSEKNPTTPETSVVVSGKAAKLASTSVLGVFAAGSIYTGKYVKTDGIGAQLSFGRPFTGRPKALKGYYYYMPGKIDKTKNPYTGLAGKADTCHIYAILTDWDEPYSINTRTGSFVNLETDSGIIAICQLKSGTTMSGYQELNLNFNYRSLTRKPKYILIVAAASKYGDYFTGSTTSVLYIDEFELVY